MRSESPYQVFSFRYPNWRYWLNLKQIAYRRAIAESEANKERLRQDIVRNDRESPEDLWPYNPSSAALAAQIVREIHAKSS